MEEKNEIANTEKEGDSNTLSNNLNDNSQNKEDARKRQLNRFNKLVKDNNIDMDNTDIGNEIKLSNEKIKNDFLKRSISILASEIDEVRTILSNEMQDFKIPSRPVSIKSEISNVSNHSHNESKQLSEA